MCRFATCRTPRRGRARGNAGSSLVAVLMVLALGITIAGVLALLSSAEVRIAAADRDAHEARYAAESGLDRALVDLQAAASWDDVLAGTMTASFALGPSQVTLADGRRLDSERERLSMQALSAASSARGPTRRAGACSVGGGLPTGCRRPSISNRRCSWRSGWPTTRGSGTGRPSTTGTRRSGSGRWRSARRGRAAASRPWFCAARRRRRRCAAWSGDRPRRAPDDAGVSCRYVVVAGRVPGRPGGKRRP